MKFAEISRVAVLFMLLWSTAGALAASYQGIVTNVTPYNGKVYMIVGSGVFDGAASSCTYTGNGMIFSIDPSTPFGRTLVAVAISAKLSGRTVWATGDGSCAGGSPFPGVGEGLVGMDLKG